MIIFDENNPNFRLKEIEIQDIEDLRVWKNAQEGRCFHKGQITSEQQKKWFESYLKKEDDFMFVLQEKYDEHYNNVGCMGFRFLGDVVDTYNIIRALKNELSNLRTINAYLLLCTYIHSKYEKEITCRVLSNNPARPWYEMNGFDIKETHDDHVVYVLNTIKSNLKMLHKVSKR